MADAKIVLSAEDRTKAAFASAKKGLGEVNELAVAAGLSFAALGAAGSVAGMVAMVKRIADSVDAFNDLKDATGASIENISALENVARRTGANFDTVGQSLIKFNQALGQTVKPGSDAEKVLQSIGLNAKTLRELDPAEALRATAGALSQFADDGNKARAVQELFGKSLKEVAPFLKDLAEAGELQATVTTEQAEEAEKFNKVLFGLSANLTDMTRQMAGPVLSTLNDIAESFGKAEGGSSKLADVVGGSLKVALQTISVVGHEVAFVFQGVGRDIGGMAAQLAALARGDFGGFSVIGQELRADAERARRENDAAIARIMGTAPAVSTAGAGRGMGGYPGLPKQSLEISDDGGGKGTKGRTKAVKELTEAERDLAFHREYSRKRQIALTDEYLKGLAAEEEAIKRLETEWAAAQRVHDDMGRAAVVSIEQRTAGIVAEIDGFGKLQSEIEETHLARLEDARAAAALGGENVDWIDRQIDAQRRLVAALKNQETLEAARAGARAAEREWDRVAQSLTDALMRGGKSAKEYLESLFRTLVLRPILEPIGKAMAGGINSVMGSFGFGGGGGGMSLPSVFNGQGGGGGLGQMFGFPNAGDYVLSAGRAAFGGTGLGATLFGTGGGGTAIATSAGALEAGVLVEGVGGSSGLLGGAMSGLGAAMPWLGAALLVASLFDKKKGGPKVESGWGFGRVREVGDVGSVQQSLGGLEAQYAALAKGLGGTVHDLDLGMFTATDPQGTAQTQLAMEAGIGGRKFYSREARMGTIENVGRSEEALQAAIAEEMTRVTLEALQESEIPGALGAYIRSLGDLDKLGGQSLNEALARINKAMGEKIALEEREYLLTHTAQEQLIRQRQREREALVESNRALYDHVIALEDLIARRAQAEVDLADAQSVLIDAYERQANAAQAAADTLSEARGGVLDAYELEADGLRQVMSVHREYARSLRDFRRQMQLSPGSTLSLGDRTSIARSGYDEMLRRAIAGDERALSSFNGYASDLLQATHASASTFEEYAIVQARIQSDLTRVADSETARVDVAQLQLSALTQLVAETLGLRDGLSMVGGAIVDSTGRVVEVKDALRDGLTLVNGTIFDSSGRVVELKDAIRGDLTLVGSAIVDSSGRVVEMRDAVVGSVAKASLADSIATYNAALLAQQEAQRGHDLATQQLTALGLLNNTAVSFGQAHSAYLAALVQVADAEKAIAAQKLAWEQEQARLAAEAAVAPAPAPAPAPAAPEVPRIPLSQYAFFAMDETGTQGIWVGNGETLYQSQYETRLRDAGLRGFADGGAFSNGIVTRPTAFNVSEMGESGPEGILPLASVNGRLGVHATGNNDRLIRELIQEVQGLRAEARANAQHAYEARRLLREFRDRGIPVANNPSGEVLQTAAV